MPIQQYDALEKRLRSARLPDEETTFAGAEFTLGPDQRYARRATAVRPRPVVSYTYSLPDSVVRFIKVELDSSIYLGGPSDATTSYREPQARYLQFLRAYKQIEQEMVARLGKPAESTPAHKEANNLGESYLQSARWETPALEASLELVFSLSTKRLPGPPNSPVLSMGGAYTYRIRANIRYKNTDKPAGVASSPASNPRQLAVAEQFMALLLAGKYAESWKLLGPDITQAITYEQYQRTFTGLVASLPAPAQGAELVTSGFVLNMGSQTYPSYTFRLRGDQANPPTKVIIILFEDASSELIGGIQPRTRTATLTPAVK